MSQKTQANEFKSTNVKLTSKNCSLTTMTIENRRFSFISAILSLSPRHGHRSLESGNKKFTSRMNSNSNEIFQDFFSFFNSIISFFARRLSSYEDGCLKVILSFRFHKFFCTKQQDGFYVNKKVTKLKTVSLV